MGYVMEMIQVRRFEVTILMALLLCGGLRNALAQSVWTKRHPTKPENSLQSVAWTGNQLVVVGVSTTMTSPDGLTWTSRTGAASNGVIWTGSQLVSVGGA